MLTPYLPYPPASGGQIRTLNLLKYLSRTNQITLIALYKNDQEKPYAKHLQAYCKKIFLCKRAEKPWQLGNILKSLFSPLPFLIVRNYSKEAKETVENLLKTEYFDVIHAETFYIMPHIRATKTPIFLLEQTIEYQVYQHFVHSLPFFMRPFFYLDILKLIFWEKHYWKKAFLVGAVSESDRKQINRLDPEIKPVVIPNGAGEEIISDPQVNRDLNNPTALFLGNFYWLQNTEAAHFLIREIYPKLRIEMPNLQMMIAGQNATNKIRIAQNDHLRIIDIDSNDVSVVKNLYTKSTVFLAPIFGPGGTRLKILAAMATGLPVISTKTGVTGLLVKNNNHVLIAETAEEFVKKTKIALSNRELYQKLQLNAFRLIKEVYNWEKIAHKLEIVYRRIKKHESGH